MEYVSPGDIVNYKKWNDLDIESVHVEHATGSIPGLHPTVLWGLGHSERPKEIITIIFADKETTLTLIDSTVKFTELYKEKLTMKRMDITYKEMELTCDNPELKKKIKEYLMVDIL